ncbi:hypothetical protein N7452_011075 [Penicillium brevicompactum]|uniref:Uncharacterized protein n=1 Tax=Penicillium brevicompactum TaxID=5074 RepID=A0A9W9U6I4_PENBR|nr:hypothetical protein N7452_011075 [Penicillium brevicompactum]
MSLTKRNNHWPGGIPSSVRRHEEPVEDVASASRAWRFFSYETRAPEDEPLFEDPNNDACLAGLSTDIEDVSICITKWTPETQAVLAKCLVALFGLDNGDIFLADNISMLLPVEDNQGDVIETCNFRQSVARPDFLDMHMTLDGTVVFKKCEPKLIIDDRTLQTGLGLWVQFQTNGTWQRAYRVQMIMQEFPDLFRDIHCNMNTLETTLDYMEEGGDADPDVILEDEPVDMRRPFMTIYPQMRASRLDQYAPGFRVAEDAGNGLAIGYDLERLLANDAGQAPLRVTQG